MTPTWAAVRCAVVVTGAVVLALVTGRPEIVAVAAPFALALALAVGDRAIPRVRVNVGVTDPVVVEDGVVEINVDVISSHAIDLAVLAVAAPDVRQVAGDGRVALPLAPGVAERVELDGVPRTWGRKHVGPATCTVLSSLGLLRAPAAVGNEAAITVLPRVTRFDAAGPLPKTFGFSGRHRSPVAGPGVEFVAVREFAPGDRPRRINWRTTQRTGVLHVNTTTTDQAARVLVMIDSVHLGSGRGRGMRDVAVHAAADIAAHYLTAGDRVGLVEYGGRNRALAPATGRAHLVFVQRWLLDVGPQSLSPPPTRDWLATVNIAGALVVVLTPLTDEAAAAQLVVLRQRGATVVAVDTFRDAPGPGADVARRLWSLERRLHADRLGDLGIPFVHWTGAGSLDIVLRDVTRLASAPKARIR